MERCINLNLQKMKRYDLNTSEVILLEYLENRVDYILDLDAILSDLNPIFNKKDTIYRCYCSLNKKGLISAFSLSYIEAYNILNVDNSNSGCLFCSCSQNLHKHHYPIKKSKGGIDTIILCSDCHFKFHSFTDYKHNYKIKTKERND